LPVEKRKGLIEKAVQWIKTKMREKQKMKQQNQPVKNRQKEDKNQR